MKMKHTPGPWKIMRASDYTGDPEHTAIMSIEAANGKTVYYTESGYFVPVEADARLIAAAPELLAALELCYEHCRLYHPSVEINNVGETVRAAIAKATGK